MNQITNFNTVNFQARSLSKTKIETYLDQGKTNREIAKLLKVDPGYLGYFMKTVGLTPVVVKKANQLKSDILELKTRTSYTQKEIATILNTNIDKVRQVLKEKKRLDKKLPKEITETIIINKEQPIDNKSISVESISKSVENTEKTINTILKKLNIPYDSVKQYLK